MAKPAFIRYLPARLKPLGNPSLWIPLAVFALLGTFVWEYYRNPDWFSREPITDLTPDSTLTAEEEAQLSEIGTLDVLLNGSRAPEGTARVTSQINPDAPDSEARATNSETSGSGLDLNAYPIPGAPSTATTITPGQSSVFSNPNQPTTRSGVGSSGSSFNFGDGLANTSSPTSNTSALADALERRQAALAEIERSSGSSESPSSSSNATSQSGSDLLGSSSNVAPGQALPAASSVPGSFIRTTPEMSPPVGTTGYQVPATSRLPTFNIAPQQPTRSPYSLPANNQFATPSAGQVVAPASAPTPAVGSPSAATPTTIYTAPSSVQPDQGPAINPRR